MTTPDPTPAAAAQSNLRLVRRMFAFTAPVRRTVIVSCVVVVLRIIAEVVAVFFLSPAVTAVSASLSGTSDVGLRDWLVGGSDEAVAVRGVLLMMAAAQVFLGITIYLRNVWDGRFSMEVVYWIRDAVYDRLQRAGFPFHDRVSSGQLINRALSDLQNVRMFVNMGLLGTLDISLYVIGYMGLLFLRSPVLALAALAPVPLWCWVVLRFGRKAQPLYGAQRDASDSLMSALTENLHGVHVVRAFAAEPRETEKYRSLNAGLLQRMFDMVGLQQRLTPMLRAIAVASHIGLFLLAAKLIRDGRLEIGDLLILGVASGTILSKLQQINAMAETYQKAIVSARRIFEILDTPLEPASAPDAPVPAITDATIEFDDVVFGYDPAKPVLDHASCRIPGNRLTAIVGPTGAGKTTMASLIARFYDPQSGAVRIDGVNVRDVDLSSLRRAVGYVFQESFLFSQSVRENIRYGRTDVSDDMVLAAAEAAQADEFIRGLSDGYDTLLGERGVTLSGGQRQRLALARALVYDPKILILDDATASLDPDTEEVVHTILNLLYAGRTVLVIAHRISTVRRADHVLVIQNGRIVQSGTPRELLSAEGHYREIALSQAMGDHALGTARSHSDRVAADVLEQVNRP